MLKWKGYLSPGDSVGILVSTDKSAFLSWNWNDKNSEIDGPNEYHSLDQNPSHRYKDDGKYYVTLDASNPPTPDDFWYFPVMVIPTKYFAGGIGVSGSDGTKLFKTGETLTFHFSDPNNTPLRTLLPTNETPVYEWKFYSKTADKYTAAYGERVNYMYSESGNYLVELDEKVQGSNTVWFTMKANVDIVDRPSITVTLLPSPNNPGCVQVNGRGFPPGGSVNVEIEETPNINSLEEVDSRGLFTSAAPLSLLGFSNGTYHVNAMSTNPKVTTENIFAIPNVVEGCQ